MSHGFKNDLISRQDAVEALMVAVDDVGVLDGDDIEVIFDNIPSAEPEIIMCKCCEYGDQDEAGRWFCRSLGCQIGDEDGSGFCADAERRTE